MILNLFCPKCIMEQLDSLTESNVVALDVPTPIEQPSDDGKYQSICLKGHKSEITVMNLKYDILFELGLNALLDGGNRDAIMNFTSSLEKFYEFFCKCHLHSISCEDEVIAKSWKSVSRFSERQLGSFIIAYTSLTKTAPQLLNPNKEIRLRNDVIHNGYIAKRKETYDYAVAVAELIYSASEELLTRVPQSVRHTYNLLSPHDFEKEQDWTSGSCNIITAMDIITPCKDGEEKTKDIQAHLDRIQKDRGPTQMFISNSKANFDSL